jgi:hypothetical protein
MGYFDRLCVCKQGLSNWNKIILRSMFWF